MHVVPDGALFRDAEEPQVSRAGRIGRMRYLAYSGSACLSGLVAVAVAAFSMSVPSAGFTALAIYIATAAIMVCLTSWRLHDLGHSGWAAFLFLAPFLNLVFLLYLTFTPGIRGPYPGGAI